MMSHIEMSITGIEINTSSSNISVLSDEENDSVTKNELKETKELSSSSESFSYADDDDENDSLDNESNNSIQEDELSFEDKIRKAKAAGAGGTLVVLGTILAPLPIPGGIPMIAAGLHVLAQEFEEAKQAEEKIYDGVSMMKTKIQEEYDRQCAEIELSIEERTNELYDNQQQRDAWNKKQDNTILPQAIAV